MCVFVSFAAINEYLSAQSHRWTGLDRIIFVDVEFQLECDWGVGVSWTFTSSTERNERTLSFSSMRSRFQGPLNKYTNAFKRYQTRYFILDAQAKTLLYFMVGHSVHSRDLLTFISSQTRCERKVHEVWWTWWTVALFRRMKTTWRFPSKRVAQKSSNFEVWWERSIFFIGELLFSSNGRQRTAEMDRSTTRVFRIECRWSCKYTSKLLQWSLSLLGIV